MTNTEKSELAEIVFKGLGGRRQKLENGVYGWQIAIKSQYDLIFFSRADLQNKFIFSWPYPNCLGLIIEAAKTFGWYEQLANNCIQFKKSEAWKDKKYLYNDCTENFSIYKHGYPMAFSLAFKEVLGKEGKGEIIDGTQDL